MPLYSRRVIHGAEKRYPIRKFLYHDIKVWLANMLSWPDIEAYANRNVFLNSQDVPEEARDIWDGKVLREFKGPDGKPFVQPSNQDGRYVFSLCTDGFNPFIMKEAGKQVSVEAIYMVLLSLPVEICYQVVNMFLVGIIPGPREPSLEQINHVLVPLVDNLLRFWKPGVFIKQTAHHFGGHICLSWALRFTEIVPIAPSQIRQEGEATVRAAGTPARREAPHEVLIRGGGWHEAEITPARCEAPHEALRGAACFSSGGVDIAQAKTRGGGVHKGWAKSGGGRCLEEEFEDAGSSEGVS